MEEESFPRGGTTPLGKGGKKRQRNTDDKDLFQSEDSPAKKPKKKVSKVTREEIKAQKAKSRKKESTALGQHVLSASIHTPAVLNSGLLVPGLLVLGVVKDVQDYSVIISLPNGQEGSVAITNISDAYTQFLEKLATGNTENTEAVASLDELLLPGMCVCCKVLDTPPGSKGKNRVKLTLNPREVNHGLTAAVLKHGMVISGCVSSCEDHGFVIDLGVAGINAFLKSKKADQYCTEYNEGSPLHVGSYLHCMISSGDRMDLMTGESRTISVVVDPRKVYRTLLTEDMKITLRTLMPGMTAQVKVTQSQQEGVIVKFLGYTGSIHRSHLDQVPEEVLKGHEMKATVLYINPTSKAVSMSTLTHLVTPDLAPKRLFGDLERGKIVQGARVCQSDKNGVHIKLDDRHNAFASKARLSDKDVKNVAASFPVGSTQACRVLGFNYADNLVIVTMKESILSQQFLQYADMKPGDKIEGTVKGLHKGGMTVQVTKQLQGLVPHIHLADIILKRPEKKYSPGDKVKCKVLVVEPGERKLILTCKKSLLRSENPNLTSYESASPGMVVEGVIVNVKEKGCLVAFYNNVKGWVPQSELSTDRVPFPEKVFYVGQIAKCRVLSVSPEHGHMKLSFKLVGKEPAGSKKADVPEDFHVGKLVDCQVTKVGSQGLDVEVLPSKVAAYLPKNHLSDNTGMRDLLKDSYKEGDVIKDVMYLQAGHLLEVTMKPSLVNAARKNQLVKNFADLQLGSSLPGTITKHMLYGMFIDLTHKVVGLAPNKFLYDRKLPEGTCLYHVGQSVVAKVTEVDQERKRLLLSLRMLDCYHGDTSIGLDILETYLSEYHRIVKAMSNRDAMSSDLASLNLGQVVKATITEVIDQGVLCELKSGIKGIAMQEHLAGVKCVKGNTLDAVVLYIDPKDQCIEVAFSAELVKAMKGRVKNKFSEVQIGQTLKSEVLMVREEFILAHLRQHGRGKLVYIPAKRHLNDVLEKHQFIVGQENPVVIKRIDGDIVLACLKLHEDKNKAKDAAEEESGLAINLGTITSAVVTQVLDEYMYIKLGSMPGRVHVSEISDVVSDGDNPLSDYAPGAKVKVKIIAVKHIKKAHQLPSHMEKCRTYVDCTVKISKLQRAGFRKVDNPQRTVYKKKHAVNVFVDRYEAPYLYVNVSASAHGRAYLPNISEKPEVLADPASFFKPGQGYLAHILSVKENTKLNLTLTSLTHDMSPGCIVNGVVSQARNDFLIVNLPSGYRGNVALTDIADEFSDSPTEEFSQNQLVKCCILNSDEKTKCALSLRPSRLNSSSTATVRDPEQSWESLNVGSVVRGYVTGSSDKGIWVSLSRNIASKVLYNSVSKHFISDLQAVFHVGRMVTAAVISIDPESHNLELSLLEEHTGIPENIPADYVEGVREINHVKRKPKSSPEKTKPAEVKEKVEAEETPVAKEKKAKKSKKEKAKRRKSLEEDQAEPIVRKKLKEEENDSGVDLEPEIKVGDTPKSSAPHLTLSSGFSWGTTLSLPSDDAAKADSDTDDSEDEEDETKSDKPKSRAEKVREKKEEEKRVYKREQELLDQERSPEAAEDFDRMVLQSPDSSIIWLRYMAYHLETAEIEKARAVAERALKTISFREEQEKLNIWVAYLNLENMYGTHESLNEVFKQALQRNEPIKVFQQLITIYEKSGKVESAEQLFEQMVRRFSLNKDVWINYGLFECKQGKAEMARKVMQRSLKSLDKRDHVETIAKFAQMEFKYGEPERGKTMFENVLSNYGKRNDLWLVYIDMVTHLGEIQNARKLFERVIALSFSAKKMKSIYKKYLDFEMKHGNEDTVANVKQKALDYVTSKSDVDVE